MAPRPLVNGRKAKYLSYLSLLLVYRVFLLVVCVIYNCLESTAIRHGPTTVPATRIPFKGTLTPFRIETFQGDSNCHKCRSGIRTCCVCWTRGWSSNQKGCGNLTCQGNGKRTAQDDIEKANVAARVEAAKAKAAESSHDRDLYTNDDDVEIDTTSTQCAFTQLRPAFCQQLNWSTASVCCPSVYTTEYIRHPFNVKKIGISDLFPWPGDDKLLPELLALKTNKANESGQRRVSETGREPTTSVANSCIKTLSNEEALVRWASDIIIKELSKCF
ncbi:hypothetical protein BGX34_006384 [Mortierella sp. NVP85]|nr:hypothetical protein BGX34_006384 [Mortierella sp. NVP85]